MVHMLDDAVSFYCGKYSTAMAIIALPLVAIIAVKFSVSPNPSLWPDQHFHQVYEYII